MDVYLGASMYQAPTWLFNKFCMIEGADYYVPRLDFGFKKRRLLKKSFKVQIQDMEESF